MRKVGFESFVVKTHMTKVEFRYCCQVLIDLEAHPHINFSPGSEGVMIRGLGFRVAVAEDQLGCMGWACYVIKYFKILVLYCLYFCRAFFAFGFRCESQKGHF